MVLDDDCSWNWDSDNILNDSKVVQMKSRLFEWLLFALAFAALCASVVTILAIAELLGLFNSVFGR